MPLFDGQQQKIALEIMQEFLAAPAEDGGESRYQEALALNSKRADLIRGKLLPLLNAFLAGDEPLASFKTAVDGLNKRHEYWGFKGIKGQMFFNIVTNVADDLEECTSELSVAIAMPRDEAGASSRIKTFNSYVKRLGEQWVEQGNTRHGCPKQGSIPYFLSYFWQLQDATSWPVYYTQSVRALTDRNLFELTGDIAQDYLTYKRTIEALRDLYSKQRREKCDLNFVEHVLWNQREKTTNGKGHGGETEKPRKPDKKERLPESYVPPVVSALPRMAKHDEEYVAAAKASGTSLERAPSLPTWVRQWHEAQLL